MDVLLAFLLLTGVPGAYEVPPTEGDFPALRGKVQKVAIEMEILDPRETSYIFAQLRDFQNDVDLLRRRYRDFRNAPPLAEAERLPERKHVNELISFNRAFRKHLSDRQALEQDRERIYDAAIIETDQCYKIWDRVRDAKCEFYYTTVRRQALAQLKEMLGEEDYYRVQLPPIVPPHLFREP